MMAFDRERLAELKRQPWQHVRLVDLTSDREQLTVRAAQIARNPELREQSDKYLFAYTTSPTCPGCGTRGIFGWGVAYGAGYCMCGWPGRVYHEIRDHREASHLVCEARCNGYDVCHATRAEHIETPIHWWSMESDTSGIRMELHCPDPTPPPGLKMPFTSRWKSPLILEFTAILWAHPYGVHIPKRQAVPA